VVFGAVFIRARRCGGHEKLAAGDCSSTVVPLRAHSFHFVADDVMAQVEVRLRDVAVFVSILSRLLQPEIGPSAARAPTDEDNPS
jgi:hypothetical protein